MQFSCRQSTQRFITSHMNWSTSMLYKSGEATSSLNSSYSLRWRSVSPKSHLRQSREQQLCHSHRCAIFHLMLRWLCHVDCYQRPLLCLGRHTLLLLVITTILRVKSSSWMFGSFGWSSKTFLNYHVLFHEDTEQKAENCSWIDQS